MNIPDIKEWPLSYVLDTCGLTQKQDTLWLEFGVTSGSTIQCISKYANQVYGFDSFLGNPEEWRPGYEAGIFSMNGVLPAVNSNVHLIPGLFQDTLVPFLEYQGKKVSFIHIDSDLYSSAKFILDSVKGYLDTDCIIVFDEFVNYPYYGNGEYKAFHEFVTENNVSYDWIGMNGSIGMSGYDHENVAVMIHWVGAEPANYVPMTIAPKPKPEPVPVPVVEPAAEPVPEPVPEPVVEPAAEPAAEPVVEPAAEPVPEPVPEPVVEPAAEPAAEPAPAPAAEPVVEPAAEPAPESAPVDPAESP